MNINAVLFRSGDLFLPKSLRRVLEYYYIGNDTSLVYVTNWTLIHFLTGLLIAYMFKRYKEQELYLTAFLLHTLWELWQIYGENTPMTPRGFVDIVVDTVAYMLGVWTFLKLK